MCHVRRADHARQDDREGDDAQDHHAYVEKELAIRRGERGLRTLAPRWTRGCYAAAGLDTHHARTHANARLRDGGSRGGRAVGLVRDCGMQRGTEP